MTAAEISARVDELIASLERRRVVLIAFLNSPWAAPGNRLDHTERHSLALSQQA